MPTLSTRERQACVWVCLVMCVVCWCVCTLSVEDAVGVSVGHCRTSEPLCRTVGLSDCRTLGMTAMTVYDSTYASNLSYLLSYLLLVLSDCRTVGLSDCRTLSEYCRSSVGSDCRTVIPGL